MQDGFSRTRARFVLTIPILAVSLALASCDDDDGPTSPAVPNVAGTWQGRYLPGIGAGFDPCGASSAAAATFRQDGARVSGTVTTQTETIGEANFEGEISGGDQLRGTLTSGGTTRSVAGSAGANHMTMSFSDHSGCSSSRIELDR
jgi:hypothetical protein